MSEGLINVPAIAASEVTSPLSERYRLFVDKSISTSPLFGIKNSSGEVFRGALPLVTTAGAEITAVTEEKSVAKASVPKEIMQANCLFRFQAWLTGTQTAAAVEYVARIRVGPTTLTGAIAALGGMVTPATARTKQGFNIEGLIKVTAPGTTAKAIGGVDLGGNFFALSTLYSAKEAVTTAVEFNSNVENLVELTLQPSAITFTAGNIRAATIEAIRL